VATKKKRKKAQKKQSGIKRFYRETVGELRKVTWPTREEATNLTIIVILVTFGMSAFLGIVDYLFSRVFALILGI
jgi:preprotein translocase subunit SecE